MAPGVSFPRGGRTRTTTLTRSVAKGGMFFALPCVFFLADFMVRLAERAHTRGPTHVQRVIAAI